jgi:hypothetical protein
MVYFSQQMPVRRKRKIVWFDGVLRQKRLIFHLYARLLSFICIRKSQLS